MQMLTAIAIAALAVSTSPAGEPYASRLPLGSLKAACTLEKRQLGTGPFFESVWLKCDAAPVLLVHPLNLVDKVAITSEDQALEFVRLFDRQSYFMALGIAELTPGDSGECYVVPVRAFEKYLKPSRAVRITLGPGTSDAALCTGCAAFEITRPVALEDGRIYEITERLLQNGYYALRKKTLLFRNADKIGTHFICDL